MEQRQSVRRLVPVNFSQLLLLLPHLFLLLLITSYTKLLQATPTSSSLHTQRPLSRSNEDTLLTPPLILTQPEEIVVGAGSNVTLACSVRGSPPITIVWFQDAMNITGNVDSANDSNSMFNYSGPPPSTKLLDEHRYEIQQGSNTPNIITSFLFLMNLKVIDSSVFLCWAENAAGSTISNFSLIVNDSPTSQYNSPPNYLTAFGTSTGSGGGTGPFDSFDAASNMQVIIVLTAFILLLLLTFICLFVLRQVTANRSSKSSQTSQSSCAKNNPKLLAVEDLDGFFEHIRSGIIDIDHHSMSPAILFNNSNNNSGNQAIPNGSPNDSVSSQTNIHITIKNHQTPADHNHHHDQLEQQRHFDQLNHFQSASDASSLPGYCDSQPSDVSSRQAFYVGQPQPMPPPVTSQQQQAFYSGQLTSNASSQKAFYVGPQPPTSQQQPMLGNATSQQQPASYYPASQQAFFGAQPASGGTSPNQAFYGNGAGTGPRTMHTLFI